MPSNGDNEPLKSGRPSGRKQGKMPIKLDVLPEGFIPCRFQKFEQYGT